MTSVKFEGRPITVAIGDHHLVELPVRVVRVRMTGLLFETDKTFLLPSAMPGIRRLVQLYAEHPGMSLAVTGHTDTVGGQDYNLGLSNERARTMAHFLRDEVDGWLEWYGKQPFSQAWGVREDQHMLSAIVDDATGAAFYAGDVHGIVDGPTRDAVLRFQSARGLAADGIAGPKTRRALVGSYMAEDGTTLPAGADVQLLGCGEHHLEIPTDDGREEQGNRRAELFLFDPGPVDPPAPASCPGPGCAYETWKQRTTETHDFVHDVELVDWEVFDFTMHGARGENLHGE